MYAGLVLKIVAVLVIALGGTQYLLYLKTGRLPEWSVPTFSFPDWKLPTPDLPALLPGGKDAEPASVKATGQTVYTWRDEQGVLHFSETPPADGPADTWQTARVINAIPAATPHSGSEAPAAVRYPGSSGSRDMSPVDQALQARDLLEQRNAEQQRVLDRL